MFWLSSTHSGWKSEGLRVGCHPTTWPLRCPSPHCSRPSRLQLANRLCCCHINCLWFCTTPKHAAPFPSSQKNQTPHRVSFSTAKPSSSFPLSLPHIKLIYVLCAHTHARLQTGKVIAYPKLVSTRRVRI